MLFRKLQFILLLIFFSSLITQSVHGAQLSGKVRDKSTGTYLPGVTIYIPDLKTGTVTDSEGYYSIENLPASKVTIQVTSIGYKRITVRVDLAAVNTKDFEMEESVTELHEFVVTGMSQGTDNNRNPSPVTIMNERELGQMPLDNVIQILAEKPGVSAVSTGPGISKPVIRGLGFNRVVVIHDGVKQEGQQWGEEHGIEIDANSVYSAEILKGPASIIYGSDAMAGVINLLSAPSLPEGKVNGNLTGGFNTNNGLYGYSLNVAGNQKNTIWSLRYSDKNAHAYKNRFDGYVYNSGFSESDLDGTIGVNRKWGFSHLNFSFYEMKPGISEGERDSVTGKFVREVPVNDSVSAPVIVSAGKLDDYAVDVPYQLINHYKVVSDNNFIFRESSLKLNLAWQQNKRKEFDDIFNRNSYGLYFMMNTVNYSLRYSFPQWKNWEMSAGLAGMWQQSENRGEEFLVPEYHLFDAGIYITARKSYHNLDISGGLRFDQRFETVSELYLNTDGVPTHSGNPEGELKFFGFDKNVNGISGALGAAWQVNDISYLKVNFSRGYRAPNIAELGSNGEHEGTFRYEIGNSSLKAEQSLQGDFTAGINSDHVTSELNLFVNSINNFIYLSALQGVASVDSLTDGLKTFKYISDDALLYGGEFSIDIHPHPFDWLHFENSLSYVYGIRAGATGDTKYLPLMPAPELTSEIKVEFDHKDKKLTGYFLKGGIKYTLKQSNIYSYNNTESVSPDYFLVNVNAGISLLLSQKFPVTLIAGVDNLFDRAYQSHLSRLKYAPENYATGRTGIYNMGRNFTFKLVLNFEG